MRDKWLESSKEIDCSCVTHCLEPIVVGDVNMRPEIVGRKTQADDQPFVSEDLLFVAENWICELRVEG